MQIGGEPRRALRQMDKAVLDHRRLCVHPRDLVVQWTIAGDSWRPSSISSRTSWLPDTLSSSSNGRIGFALLNRPYGVLPKGTTSYLPAAGTAAVGSGVARRCRPSSQGCASPPTESYCKRNPCFAKGKQICRKLDF